MQHAILTAIHPPHFWKEPVTDPYKLLEEFFDYTSIELQHMYTESFINAACTAAYVKENPGSMLSWYEKTQVLFYASDLIYKSDYEKDIDLGIDVSSLPWKLQPHHLRDYEIKDPYIAIESVFEFMSHEQWRIELHTWLHAALYEHSVLEEVSRSHETIMHLHKLADAMWMLWLKYRAGNPKPGQQPLPGEDDEHDDENNKEIPIELSSVLKDFFTGQSAEQARAELWSITKLALMNDTEETDAKQRSNMLFLYEQLCALINVLDEVNNKTSDHAGL